MLVCTSVPVVAAGVGGAVVDEGGETWPPGDVQPIVMAPKIAATPTQQLKFV